MLRVYKFYNMQYAAPQTVATSVGFSSQPGTFPFVHVSVVVKLYKYVVGWWSDECVRIVFRVHFVQG